MSRRRFTLDRGGARVAVRDGGGTLPPIVLTHGLGGSALAFKRVTPLLTDTFRVITYDIRGHGASSRSDDYSWRALVGDLHALVRELELERPVLAGHSLGAGIALSVAASLPDCAGFAALDGALPVPMPPPDWSRLERAARAPSFRVIRGLMRMTRVGAALSIPEMQAMAEDYRSRWEAFAAALQDLTCPAVYVLGSRATSGPDGEAALAAVRTGADRIAEIAPGIEVRWLATGHHMTRTMPREVADALRGLSARRPPRLAASTGPARRSGRR